MTTLSFTTGTPSATTKLVGFDATTPGSERNINVGDIIALGLENSTALPDSSVKAPSVTAVKAFIAASVAAPVGASNVTQGGVSLATLFTNGFSRYLGSAGVLSNAFFSAVGWGVPVFDASGLTTTAGFGGGSFNNSGGTFSNASGSISNPGYAVVFNSAGNVQMQGKAGSVIAGSQSATATATTTFTVNIGQTMTNATYKVVVTGNNALSSANHFTTNKTTTSFDVMYLTGLTGVVAFDWVVAP